MCHYCGLWQTSDVLCRERSRRLSGTTQMLRGRSMPAIRLLPNWKDLQQSALRLHTNCRCAHSNIQNNAYLSYAYDEIDFLFEFSRGTYYLSGECCAHNAVVPGTCEFIKYYLFVADTFYISKSLKIFVKSWPTQNATSITFIYIPLSRVALIHKCQLHDLNLFRMTLNSSSWLNCVCVLQVCGSLAHWGSKAPRWPGCAGICWAPVRWDWTRCPSAIYKTHLLALV